jgi:HSP20 family protein
MTFVRYHPYGTQHPVHEGFRQFFDRFFGNEEGDQSDVVTSQWTPRVDIREEADRFVIQADIPGVDPKDIEIQMEKGVLTLKGERNAETAKETDKYNRVERTHGVFHRRFALPDSANPDGITAAGRNGVLEIVIPKRPETAARRIQIG